MSALRAVAAPYCGGTIRFSLCSRSGTGGFFVAPVSACFRAKAFNCPRRVFKTSGANDASRRCSNGSLVYCKISVESAGGTRIAACLQTRSRPASIGPQPRQHVVAGDFGEISPGTLRASAVLNRREPADLEMREPGRLLAQPTISIGYEADAAALATSLKVAPLEMARRQRLPASISYRRTTTQYGLTTPGLAQSGESQLSAFSNITCTTCSRWIVSRESSALSEVDRQALDEPVVEALADAPSRSSSHRTSCTRRMRPDCFTLDTAISAAGETPMRSAQLLDAE